MPVFKDLLMIWVKGWIIFEIMVPTSKEILFSRTKLPFSGQSIQDINNKGNKSRYVRKSISYLFNV